VGTTTDPVCRAAQDPIVEATARHGAGIRQWCRDQPGVRPATPGPV